MLTRSIVIIVFNLAQCFIVFSQTGTASKTQSDAKSAKEIYNYTVHTCFQSQRLEAVIKQTWENWKKKDTTGDHEFIVGNIKLSNSDFESLSPSEKFIYAHQYPESYMQTCGLLDIVKDMSMLPANIPFLFDGERMSERQIKSLQDNRDTAIACLDRCIDFRSHIPLAYKRTIIEINAWEFIPSILRLEERINKSEKQALKDPYVYSLLMVMMKDNEFGEFIQTNIYKTLYGSGSGYRAKINFTPAIRNQLIDLANKFYQLKASKETPNARPETKTSY